MTGGGVSGTLRSWLAEGAVQDAGFQPKRPLPPASLIAAGLAWVFALAVFAVSMKGSQTALEAPEALSAGRYEFVLLEDAYATEFGVSAQASVEIDGETHRVQLLLEKDEPLVLQRNGLLLAQERVEAFAAFRAFSQDAALRYASEMLEARADGKDLVRPEDQGPFEPLVNARRWALDLFQGMEGQGVALLRAVLMGDRSMLEQDGLYDSMKTVGLAHMVAVSGSHLAVIAALLSAAFSKAPLPRRLQAVILGAFYASYVVFTGLSAPVVRSAVMASIVVFSVWSGRRSSSLAALGVCVCVLLALQPYQALSLSFYLSAGSTLGVIVLTPLFSAWMSALTAGRLRTVGETCAMTAAAGIPIFPVTVSVFARMSLVAPLANLAAAPVFTILLGAGLLCVFLSAALPHAGMLGLHVLAFLAGLFCEWCGVLARLPYAAVPASMNLLLAVACAAALFVALWVAWPRPHAALARMGLAAATLAFVAWCVVAPRLAGDQLVMLDVGQGDAFLLRSQGHTLLVDTGNQDQKLLSALARQGASSLDGVVLTHHDADHCGSLPVLDAALAGGGCVYLAEGAFSCSCENCRGMVDSAAQVAGAQDVRALSCGDVVHLGRFSCQVVWPGEFSDEGGNADSVCLLVEYDADQDGRPEFRVLMTGDAEADQLEDILDVQRIQDVDVFKAGHHGSRAGLNEELALRLSPSVALVSVGEGNSYGHPAPEVLQQLSQAGSQVFRTDVHGDVACCFKGSTMEVIPQKLG